jgi:hypothetical protein
MKASDIERRHALGAAVMTKYAIVFLFLATPAHAFGIALGGTEIPLPDRQRMHEQSCYVNAPPAWKDADARERWIADCLRSTPLR